jgi:hypothetical protein
MTIIFVYKQIIFNRKKILKIKKLVNLLYDLKMNFDT